MSYVSVEKAVNKTYPPGPQPWTHQGSLLVVDLSFYPHMVDGVRELFRASCIRALISFRRAPPMLSN